MSKKDTYHFEMSERKLLLRLLDVGLALLGLHFLGRIFDFDYFIIREDKWLWSLLLAGYIWFFGSIFEIYDLQKSSNFFKIIKGIVITISVTFIFYLLTPFLTPELPNSRIQLLYFYLTMILSMSIGRLLYIGLIHSPIFIKNVIVIANGKEFTAIEKNLAAADPNYRIKYFINTDENQSKNHTKEISSAQLIEKVKEGLYEIVVTQNAKFSSPTLYNKLLSLFNEGYVIKEYAQVYEELSNRVLVNFKDEELFKQFPFSKYNNKPLYRVFRRFFDIIASVLGLILFAFLFPWIIVVNFFANRGPLFYSQKRVGKNGKTFNIHKLRSMVVNAEKEGAVWAQKNDTRITKFGKFLRKTRLDEFPQFYNILKGEMSVIGPRPERPIFVQQLSTEITFYPTRHIVKPGLTGWAQVNTAYASTLEGSLEKLQYDLYYIKNRNIFLDFNIIIKTLSTVLFFRGQ